MGAGVIILFGLYVAGVFKPSFLFREYRLMGNKKPIGYAGALLVGISFGIAWTPCVGPALGAILTLASSQGGIGQGTGLLVIYSAGLAIPFLLSSVALNTFFQIFEGVSRVDADLSTGGRRGSDPDGGSIVDGPVHPASTAMPNPSPGMDLEVALNPL